MFGESFKLCNGDFRWSLKMLPWGSWGQRWPGSRRLQFYKVEEAGRSISRECPGNRGSKFFAMIPISNLAVASDVDHGKRSVGPPAETEHCHHDNHLATWCKHRSDWCTLACSNLRRKNTISEWCSNIFFKVERKRTSTNIAKGTRAPETESTDLTVFTRCRQLWQVES